MVVGLGEHLREVNILLLLVTLVRQQLRPLKAEMLLYFVRLGFLFLRVAAMLFGPRFALVMRSCPVQLSFYLSVVRPVSAVMAVQSLVQVRSSLQRLLSDRTATANEELGRFVLLI